MSLPATVLLRQTLPDWDITLVCRKDHHPVLRELLAGYQVSIAEPTSGVFKPVPTAALFLFSEPRWQWQAMRERITIRVGSRTKWFSLFFMTKSIRQSRSRAEKSEAHYNMDLARTLLEQLGISTKEKPPKLLIPENAVAKANAEAILAKLGVKQPYVVIHPGMGGSALNLKDEQYLAVVKELSSQCELVVTSGPAAADQRLKQVLEKGVSGLKVVEGIAIETLAEVFRSAQAVIAPSTGPLHLAHLVGARTIGLFSPVRTHHPDRWAPYGGLSKVSIVLPEVTCPGVKDCLGPKCPEFLCMDKVAWPALVLKASAK